MTERFTLTAIEETKTLAQALALRLTGRELLLLEGDLGAGKTTFVAALAEVLGIESGWVSSPSFTLVQRYPAGSRGFGIVHLDLYRLPDAPSLEPLGLDDLLTGPDLIVVEWPKAGDALWPDCDRPIVRIRFIHAGETAREVEVDWE